MADRNRKREWEKDGISVPSHFKKYTIQNRKIVVTQPMQELREHGSYDGSKNAKKIDLALEGEDPPKLVYIATDLSHEEEEELVKLLREYRDVFAWSYKERE